MTLGSLDGKGIGRYDETTPIPAQFSDYMNEGIESISDALPHMVASSQAARDAYWGTPATAAARRALQDRGATTIRLDTGQVERYFALTTDGGANPGGRAAAGWVASGDDSGWIAATLNAGWAAVAGEAPSYRKKSGVVYLRGRANTTGAGAAAFTLPAGFRPAVIVVWQAEKGNASRQSTVTAGGVVGEAAAAAGNGFSFSSCPPFLVD